MRVRVVAIVLFAAGMLALGAVLVTPDRPTRATGATPQDRPVGIAALQARLARVPGDWQSWAALGLAHVELARTSADPSHYLQAEQALRRSLTVRPDNAPALAGLGALAAARHQFADALRSGQAAITADPFHAPAHGVVFDALIELGRYDEAATAAQRMLDLRPDAGSYARASYLFELRGAVPAAREAMTLALKAAPAGPDAAFAQQHLAQLAFDSGDLDTAQSHVDEGLRVVPDSPPLRALRARLLAARGDLAGAAGELRTVVTRLPLPGYAVQLADVSTVLGDAESAKRQWDLVRASADLFAAAGVAMDLELVAYQADRVVLDGGPLPADVLAAARAGYAANPSVTAAGALAWALHAAGRHAEALPYADAALRLGTRDATLHYRRGAIRLALGDRTGARTDLAEALRINPHFSLRHAPRARTLLGGLA